MDRDYLVSGAVDGPLERARGLVQAMSGCLRTAGLPHIVELGSYRAGEVLEETFQWPPGT